VFGLGWMELLLILIIVLVIFGAGKLPQIGEGIGKAVKGFKKSIEPEPQQLTDEPNVATRSAEAPPVPPAPPAGEHPQSARL
jgi:sec-independent protein translocase protein TatA